MVYLRVQLLGVQAQEPWKYYVTFQILEPGSAAASALPQHGAASGVPAVVVCRTDTARASRTPEFSSRTFLLRMPAQGLNNNATTEFFSSHPGPKLGDCSDLSPARLAVSLFAAPSVDAPAGPIVAGVEVDRLVASAVLDLDEQLLQRLGAGEHVAVPVLLQESPACKAQQMPDGLGSQAAQLQSLRNSQQMPNSRPNVLLELMLLCAQQPGAAGGIMNASAQHMYQQAAAAAAGFDSSMQLGSSYGGGREGDQGADGFEAAAVAADTATDAAASEGDVELLLLVSGIRNMPLVPGPQGQLESASAFVALRIGVDAVSKGPPMASTAAAEPSAHPSWGELLSMKCHEAQLSHSRLQISVMSASTNRAIAKGCLKLSGIVPGQHYPLALALTESCTLFMTVVLGYGANTLLAALQGSGLGAAAAESAGKLQLLQLGLPQLSNRTWQGLLSPAAQALGSSHDILAVWRSAGGSSQQQQQQQQQQQALYIHLDGREGSEAASAAMLRVYNSSNGLLAVGGPSRASSAASSRDAAPADGSDGSSSLNLKGVYGVLAAVPLCSCGQEVPWPKTQQLILPVLLTEQAAVTLELHIQPHAGNSSSSSSSSSKTPASVCFARLMLPLSSLTGQSAGKPFKLSQLQLRCNPQLTTADAADAQVSLQAARWDIPRFFKQLEQLARHMQQEQQKRQQQQQQQQRLQQVPALLASASPVPGLQSPAQGKSSRKQQAAAAAGAAAVHAVQGQPPGSTEELLLGDVLAKQQALERLQRQLDIAGQHAEAADGRVAELQATNSNLTGDLQHLRQLLHEEKEAAASAASLLDSSQPHLLPGTHILLDSATKEQVLQQLSVALGKHATERARNGELVRRLQQLHAEKVDVMELQRQYVDLQEAHYQQSKLLVDQEIHQTTLSTLKQAVTDQEALISRLQQLLGAAAARTKELEGWKATASTLQQEVDALRHDLDNLTAAGAAAEQQAAAQAAEAALEKSEAAAAAAAASFDAQLVAKESERLGAVMRAEKAETSAVAAQNELMDVTKRYAREIAQLKTKLAEKDAQLLGGFGSIDHLTFGQSSSRAAGALAATGLSDFPQSPGFNPGAFGFGAFAAGLPTLHELGQIPGPAMQAVQPIAATMGSNLNSEAVGSSGAAERVPPAGRLSSSSRAQSGGGATTLAASAAAAAGRASPKLPNTLYDNGNRGQQRSSGSAMGASGAEAAGVGAVGFQGSGSASGQGFAQQGSYTLRAGSAEARLMHQGTGSAANGQGTPGRVSKPGSPLLPTGRQQERLTNSADGARATGMAMQGSVRATGSPSQQQQQQHSQVPRAVPSPQQAWAASSLPQQQQRQQQQQVASQPLSGSEYEDEDEDLLEDEGDEDIAIDSQPIATVSSRRQAAALAAGSAAPNSMQRQHQQQQERQQQQRQQQQQHRQQEQRQQQQRQQQPLPPQQPEAPSPKKRGRIAGFFSRG